MVTIYFLNLTSTKLFQQQDFSPGSMALIDLLQMQAYKNRQIKAHQSYQLFSGTILNNSYQPVDFKHRLTSAFQTVCHERRH